MKVLKEKKEVNGKIETIQTIYYSLKEVGIEVGKSYATILDYTKYSDELEAQGKERLVPKAVEIDGRLYLKKDDIEQVQLFVRTMKKGDLAQFSKRNESYHRLKERNELLEKEVEILRKQLKQEGGVQ